MLMDVASRESQWGTGPGGKVAFTQNEESSYAMGYGEKYTAESLAQKRPLRAESFLLKYRKLFEGGALSNRFDSARSHTKEAGKASCKSLLPSPKVATKHPYYYSFIRQYCAYWGEKTAEPSAESEKFHK